VNITWRGRKFTHQWTEVPAAIAALLKALDQPSTPGVRLFDVKTESQVERMEAHERDKDLEALINKNRLKEDELRQLKERRDPRSDFDDEEDEEDEDAELEADIAANEAEAEAAEPEEADEAEEFDPDPDPDGSKADAELRAEENGDKDWSEWEADLTAKDESPVEGPPVPAKKRKAATAAQAQGKKKTAKKVAKKTARGRRKKS
jgi:hypothetical protein